MEKIKISDLLEEVKLGKNYYDIKINEDLYEDVILVEGVKYFKASVRLNKLADRLARKDTKELNPIIEITRRASKEFEMVEGKFDRKEINKTQAKMRINSLKRYYSALLKQIKHKDFSRILKIGGVAAILGGIIASILFGFQPLQAIGVALPKWDQVKNTFGMLENEVGKQFGFLRKAFQSKVVPFVKSAIEEEL